jgi:hypothetical protein
VTCEDGGALEGGGDHAAGGAFAEADDEILGARGELADGRDAAQQLVEGVELLVEFEGEIFEEEAGDELRGGGEVAFAELLAECGCGRRVRRRRPRR